MSFLDKLKKNMGVEKESNIEIENSQKITTELELEKKLLEQGTRKIEIKDEKLNNKKGSKEKKEKWFKEEGQLIIDVYQTETDLIIQTAIAGIKPEDLDITMEKDVIIIRGERKKPLEEEGDYFVQECYWGSFFKEIILPVEVDPDRAEASMKEGILTIQLPKTLREKRRRIEIIG